MGVRIEYTFPALHDPYGLIEGSSANLERKRMREREQRTERLGLAREIIHADIQPSDAEADDFFRQIAVDAFAASRDSGDPSSFPSEEVLSVYDFYEARSYTYDWLEKLTPELRRQVEIEMGIYITKRWFAQVQADGVETAGTYVQYNYRSPEQNDGAMTEVFAEGSKA